MDELVQKLAQGDHPVTPLHWEIEFPEVFARRNGGFDTVIGNPPFLKGSEVSGSIGHPYLKWLQFAFPGFGGQSDIVALFLRRAFEVVRDEGTFGLVATKTVSRGDTRTAGLEAITNQGGNIYSALKRVPWPGEAAVTVSVVWVIKRSQAARCVLDGRACKTITTFLLPIGPNTMPARLVANAGIAFEGYKYTGQGFLFSEQGGDCEDFAKMKELTQEDPRNRERIRPLLRGETFLEHPSQTPDRYVIDFEDFTEEKARSWPLLFAILERRVKPFRAKSNRDRVRRVWWLFEETRPGLRAASKGKARLLMRPKISAHHAFGYIPGNVLVSAPHVVVVRDEYPFFAILQSRVHELWVYMFGAYLEDRICYTPSDCLETFPSPNNWNAQGTLLKIGSAYCDSRIALMVERNEGMTKTYNRFHDPTDTAEDVQRLRELHAAMDRAVLEAYDWHDLAARAAPVFLDESNEDDHTYQGRLFWPSDFRDEVLARLLALNAERHAEEVRLGIAPGMKGTADEHDDEDSAD